MAKVKGESQLEVIISEDEQSSLRQCPLTPHVKAEVPRLEHTGTAETPLQQSGGSQSDLFIPTQHNPGTQE